MAFRLIRLLGAFLTLRWRLFVNGLSGRRRDALERVSRISRVFVAASIALTVIPASMILMVIAFAGGRGVAEDNPNAAAVFVGAQAVLGLVTILVALTPVLRFGAAPTSSTRLSLLPVPRSLLHAAHLVAQLADPWVLALVPALLALPAGLLSGGRGGTGGLALLAAVAILAFLASLGSAASLFAGLVFRNRRIGELATIGVLLIISASAFLPTAFIRDHAKDPKGTRVVFEGKHPWLDVTPGGLYARAIEQHTVAPLVTLALATIVLSGASRWAFGRLLDGPGDTKLSVGRAAAPRRFVGLSPPAAAIAWATFRLAARSVRGRVILFTSPIPVLMLAILWKRILIDNGWSSLVGVMVLGVGSALTLFSLQTILVNQFAVDRAGLTLTFLGPASARQIVFGKAAGGALIFAAPQAVAAAIAILLHPKGPMGLWVAALVSALAAYVAQTPVAAFVSAAFPAACDLMKLRAGNVHPLAGICGMLTSVAVSAAAAAVFAGTYVATGSVAAVVGSSLVVLAAACVWAAAGLSLAAQALDLRRENLAMIAQGR